MLVRIHIPFMALIGVTSVLILSSRRTVAGFCQAPISTLSPLIQQQQQQSIGSSSACWAEPPPQRRRLRPTEEQEQQNPLLDGWDGVKKAFYGSVDQTNTVMNKVQGIDDDMDSGVLSDGYASFEQSTLKEQKKGTPAEKIMSAYQQGAASKRLDNQGGISADDMNSNGVTQRDGFDVFKEVLYSAADALKGGEEEIVTPLQKLGVPTKPSLAQELGNEDLLSTNPVKRFQAEQKVREFEARKRAEVRQEKMRANKEDLYKVVDAFQDAVDAIPEVVDATQKTAKEVVSTVRQIPFQVEKVTREVQTIPKTVQQTAQDTQKSIEATVENTKRVVDDVIDTPNKVKKQAEETQKSILKTKESIEEGFTGVKVFLRLEKPKPKPPKKAPPKPKTAKDIALNIVGGTVKGAGKVAWWGAKGGANLAWSGAKTAFERGKESVDATSSQSTTAAATVGSSKASSLEAMPSKDDEVSKEVEEALKLAKETLKRVSEDGNNKT